MAYLMTHSLLAAWLRSMEDDPDADATKEDTSKQDFLRVLCRQPTPTTEAMQNGIEFENLVTDIVNGKKVVQEKLAGELIPNMPAEMLYEPNSGEPMIEHIYPRWYEPAKAIADIIRGGQLQVVATKRVTVSGMDFLLYGRLDGVKAGSIYDIKFSGVYQRGKYFDSTQHPMYMELLPEASDFTYLVSNGKEVWTERYRRDETPSIYPIISDFVSWLNVTGNMALYQQYWGAK